ncbi:MAG: ABC transporter ATP-binding protein [Bacteroidota bacterium]|jgi:ABC-type sugar transport system ATPase subunit
MSNKIKNAESNFLSLNNLAFNYPNQNSFDGLKHINFEVAKGEFVAILGKSGSGKSTLLKCIYGIEDLNGGEIFFCEEKVFGPSRNLIPGTEGMSLVSQEFYVLENHTVTENILDKLAGYSNDFKLKRLKEILSVLQLKPFESKKAKELSSGQRQRLSIARALADFPKLLLLDEPFSNLDAGLKDDLLNYIRRKAKSSQTAVIMVTHQAEDALRFSDKIIVLKEGKCIQQGTPEDVYYRPKSMEVARLFGKAFRLKNAHSKIKVFRPEYFEPGNKKDNLLKIEVKENNFCGGCFEISGKDESNNSISFYSENPISENRKEVFLKLRRNLLSKF